ncbi:MAG: ferritin-like domain-containing protein [Deltaproteobacteria bacterium]|nr:ferritin-like domain-containing protein [Deltaproteobacteria bacterium]
MSCKDEGVTDRGTKDSGSAVDARRFPIEREATRLKVVHRQRVQRQGDADPAPAFDARGVDPTLLQRAVSGWQSLVETEHESIVISAWMTAGLSRFGAPLDIIGAFGRVVEDEIRHVDVAAQMVEMYGGHPTVLRLAAPPVPVGVEGALEKDVEFELMGGLVGFFCVFEHLSAHVFRQALEAAELDVAKWALSEIHRDEAFHGAFGFETAKVFVPKWKDEDRRRLSVRTAEDIRRFERRLGGPSSERAPKSEELALERMGLLSPPALLSVFYQAVAKELLPRLRDELGIPIEIADTSAR